MGSKTNRSLQAKYIRSRRQCASFVFDAVHTEAMHEASLRENVQSFTASQIAQDHARRVERRARLFAHW